MIVQTHFVSHTAILSAISVGLLYLTGCSVAPSTAKPDSNTINTPATIPNTQAQKNELDTWVKSGKDVRQNKTFQTISARMKACGNGVKFNKARP